MSRLPRYTLVRLVQLEEALGANRHLLRLQFRGPKIDSGERVLTSGTLPQILEFARGRYGEEEAQRLVDEAVALQRRSSDN